MYITVWILISVVTAPLQETEALLEHSHHIRGVLFCVHISFVQKLLNALVIFYNFPGCHRNEWLIDQTLTIYIYVYHFMWHLLHVLSFDVHNELLNCWSWDMSSYTGGFSITLIKSVAMIIQFINITNYYQALQLYYFMIHWRLPNCNNPFSSWDQTI